MKKRTHYDRIKQHLIDYGHITSWTAIKEYGITRLSHYIYIMRKEGHTIETLNTTSLNRYNDKISYATYKLID